jgi:uroporphyrinogen decarboxylase
MNRKEAVIKVLRHKQTNPVPYSLDMSDETLKKLIKHTGDSNFYQKSGSYLEQQRNESFIDEGEGKFRDMFGALWDKGSQEGDFGIVREYPLAEPALGNYVFPKPNEALIREKCERLEAVKDKFTMYIIGFSLFERGWTLRSMTGLLCDMIDQPSFVDELFERIVRYNCAVVDIVSQYNIDCIFFGDDWGQQKGLIMGYPYWKRFIRPSLQMLYLHVKQKGMFVAQHSCGDCAEVFPDLIDMGLDIYNTFQPEIYDVKKMKMLYGNHITFYGGVSTQRLLPFATPDQVKAETQYLIKTLGRGGGYIVAPTHAIPVDVPEQNVLAFLEAIQNQGG